MPTFSGCNLEVLLGGRKIILILLYFSLRYSELQPALSIRSKIWMVFSFHFLIAVIYPPLGSIMGLGHASDYWSFCFFNSTSHECCCQPFLTFLSSFALSLCDDIHCQATLSFYKQPVSSKFHMSSFLNQCKSTGNRAFQASTDSRQTLPDSTVCRQTLPDSLLTVTYLMLYRMHFPFLQPTIGSLKIRLA